VVSVCLRVVAPMLSEAFHRLRTDRERVGNSHSAGQSQKDGSGRPARILRGCKTSGLSSQSKPAALDSGAKRSSAVYPYESRARGSAPAASSVVMERARCGWDDSACDAEARIRAEGQDGGGGEAAGVTAKCSGVRFSCPPACWLGSAWLSRSSESIGGNPFAAATWDKFVRGCSMHHRIVQPPGAARGRSGSGASTTQHGAPERAATRGGRAGRGGHVNDVEVASVVREVGHAVRPHERLPRAQRGA